MAVLLNMYKLYSHSRKCKASVRQFFFPEVQVSIKKKYILRSFTHNDSPFP